MNQPEIVTAQNVDLSNCDREQIQFAGAILPHGVLVVLREPELTIAQVSSNVGTALGMEAEALLGGELRLLVGDEQAHVMQGKLQSGAWLGPPARIAAVELNGTRWNVLAHRNDQVVLLELEPGASGTAHGTAELYAELRMAVGRLRDAKSSQEFLDLAVGQIRALTGFDRVMAYKFLPDGSGRVCAESVIAGKISYAGQHFPPTDIPVPARRIYAMSWIRHQPDIEYVPVAVIPPNNPTTGQRLDMSYAVLRSVSPMYIGYLKNMGTRSSLVMTLMNDGKPWGLIACHHHSGSKYVGYEVRTACELFANMVSLLIKEKEELEFADYKLALKTTQRLLIEAMSKSGEFAKVLLREQPSLQDFVRAGGVAVVTDGKISLLGKTPTEEQVLRLVEWISANSLEEVFTSDSLAVALPEAAEYCGVASGVLAVRFAATRKDYLLWFRPEVKQTVKWAGDPSKPVDYSADGQRLLPRTSFALWIETVSLKCEPWLELEKHAAREFRIAILEIIMRQAERLSDLYKNLERSHLELDAFAVATSAKFKAVFEQTYVFAGIMAVDGTVMNANRVWLEMCGYTAEEVLGRPFWKTGWWRGSEELQTTIREASENAARGTAYRSVLNYYWADGTERLVEFAIHPIRDEDGKIIFLHPTGLDITDLKRAEGELRKSQEELEEKVATRTRELALSLTLVESEVAVRQRTEEQLRELSAKVLRLQDEERRRIARDLHDSTGQTLSALKMVLTQLERLVTHVPQTPELLTDLNELADQGLQEIRTISCLLHPPMLDEVGFASAAQWYVEGVAKRSGVKITLDLATESRLAIGAELALFRVLQESLTNVLRHSGSTIAEVRLYAESGNIVLAVRDRGHGISAEKVRSFNETGGGAGVGLGSMKERLRDFGGQLRLESDAAGTVIWATLPLNMAAVEERHGGKEVVRN